jgi:hypothetical protein
MPCVPYNGTGFKALGVGYYYHSTTYANTFSAARAYCKSLHPYSDIAVIKEPENWNFLNTYLAGKQKWIGLFQDSSNISNFFKPFFEPDNNWTWVDGTPADGVTNPYFRSLPGQPDNFWGEECSFFLNGYMYDTDCLVTTIEALCSIPSNLTTAFITC